MKLETPDGRLFSLLVEEYEFPDEELGPTEDNPAEDFETDRFLIVSHSFRNADGEWTARGPTMTTSELQRFCEWLEAIRDGTVSTIGVYFTDRDLEITIDDSHADLHVHVFSRFLPPWVNSADSVTISFPIGCVDFIGVLKSLQDQLSRFPARPPIGDTN